MKLFECDACGQPLYFENTHCENCGRRLGFLPHRQDMIAVEAEGEGEELEVVRKPEPSSPLLSQRGIRRLQLAHFNGKRRQLLLGVPSQPHNS